MRQYYCTFIAILLSVSVYSQSNIIVMETETSIGMQTYFTSGSSNGLQTDKIKEYWDQDYYITSAAHGTQGWFVTMSKGVKWTNQSYSYKDRWPDDWVHEMKEQGKFITSLASSDNKWFLVASTNSDYTKQEICAAPWSNLKEWITKWWNNDYYITSIACQNNMWTVVMSKTSLYKNQSYFWSTTTDELKKKISEKWNAGYYITALEYGGGEYFCIMSQYADGKNHLQHWNIGSSYSKDVKEYWDKNYRITYIGG